MKRRSALAMLGAGAWPGFSASAEASEQALVQRLKRGGCVFMMRHAQTEAGSGDPPEFEIGQCKTQRNLSDEGRAQAQRVGQWFVQHGLQPRLVQTSQWCRCQDTGRLAFGGLAQQTDLPALNSSFSKPERQAAQTAQLKHLLRQIPAGQFEVWVTHQVNMTDLTQAWPATGEAFVLDAQARLVGRRAF